MSMSLKYEPSSVQVPPKPIYVEFMYHKCSFFSERANIRVSKNNYFTGMCIGFEAGSYSRLLDFCITQR